MHRAEQRHTAFSLALNGLTCNRNIKIVQIKRSILLKSLQNQLILILLFLKQSGHGY